MSATKVARQKARERRRNRDRDLERTGCFLCTIADDFEHDCSDETGRLDEAAQRERRLDAKVAGWEQVLAGEIARHGPELMIDDGWKFTAEQMSNAFVYQQARELDSFGALATQLETRPSIAKTLGFDWPETPSREAFRRWWNDLPEPTQEFIQEEAAPTAWEDFQHHSQGFGILDIVRKAKTRKLELERNYADAVEDGEVTTAQQLAAVDEVRDLLRDGIEDTRDQDKVEHSMPDLLSFIGALGKTGNFASAVLRTLNEPQGDAEEWNVDPEQLDTFDASAPTPTGFFDALRQHEWQDYHEMFEEIFRKLFKRLERLGLFDRPVELMIDGTTIPFYPGKSDESGSLDLPLGVTGGAEKNHTHYGFTFLTISAADPTSGRTYTLASFPVWRDGLTHVGLTYLIKRAQEFVTIDRLYMDAEFRAIENLNWLDEQEIDFIVRYHKKGWRKKWVRALTGEATAATVEKEIGPNNKASSGTYTFLAVRRKEGSLDIDVDEGDGPENYTLDEFREDNDEFTQSQLSDFDEYLDDAEGAWDIYATNIEDATASTARELKNGYDRRSAIEPEYDYSKNGSVAKGGGRNYEVRVLYWLLGITIVNAVKLADLMVKNYNDTPLDKDAYDIPIKRAIDFFSRDPFFEPEYG